MEILQKQPDLKNATKVAMSLIRISYLGATLRLNATRPGRACAQAGASLSSRAERRRRPVVYSMSRIDTRSSSNALTANACKDGVWNQLPGLLDER